jgi:hypothetical protein
LGLGMGVRLRLVCQGEATVGARVRARFGRRGRVA